MTLELINETKWRVPRSFLSLWVRAVSRDLKIKSRNKMTIAFVDSPRSKALNLRFRRQNKATDVLSFDSLEKGSLGELVICVPLVKSQAREHLLSVQEELGYLVLHGILHLLGYEHENGGANARKMFRLQDR